MRELEKLQSLFATPLGAASALGNVIQVSNCKRVTVTYIVTTDAADLITDLSLGSTSADPTVSTYPALTNGVALTPLPTGFTIAAGGALAIASPAAGTHEITVNYPAFGAWVRARHVYTSGGGTFSIAAMIAAWG